MKYQIWKLPYPVSHEDKNGNACDGHFIYPIQGEPKLELIGVEFGSSIEDVAEEIINDIHQDMVETYQCDVSVDHINDFCFTINSLTRKDFHYEVAAYAHIPHQPVNTLILFGIREMEENQINKI